MHSTSIAANFYLLLTCSYHFKLLITRIINRTVSIKMKKAEINVKAIELFSCCFASPVLPCWIACLACNYCMCNKN